MENEQIWVDRPAPCGFCGKEYPFDKEEQHRSYIDRMYMRVTPNINTFSIKSNLSRTAIQISQIIMFLFFWFAIIQIMYNGVESVPYIGAESIILIVIMLTIYIIDNLT